MLTSPGDSLWTIQEDADTLLTEDLLNSPISDTASSTASASEETPYIDAKSTTFYDDLNYSETALATKLNRELIEHLKDQSSVFSEALKDVIPGYTLLSKISSDLFRGFSRATRRSVLVKYTPFASAGSITRYFNEWYSLCGSSIPLSSPNHPKTVPKDLEGVLYPIEFIKLENKAGFAMIYEDVLNLKSLKEVFVQGLVKNDDKALNAIIQSLQILKKVHNHGFTHNGLTANTILLNDNNEVYLTGWDFAFQYDTEDCTKGYRTINKRFLIDWLPYMAPEVSGEINRLADYRSDLYSIGVILYQIFTGSLPFFASDSRELINKHISEIPINPIKRGVPEFLSKVIMRLLSKNAIERYQDCEFLIDDLRFALSYESNEPDSTGDSLKVSLPRGLYGREKELQFIQDICFDTTPGVQTVLLTGETGAGKTRLVDEIQRIILTKSRHFASWKCSSKRTGFACFISILNSILHQVMSSSEEEVLEVRDDILNITGSTDLSSVFNYLPELRDLMGTSYTKHITGFETEEKFMVRSELRFRQILKLLFIALGTRTPLIMCFDDLQWFSLGDLDLLNEIRSEILNSESSASIVLISTFDTSISADLEDYRKNLTNYREIDLQPIPFQSYYRLIHDAISLSYPYRLKPDTLVDRFSEGDVDHFSKAFYDKTGGNLLVTQLLFSDLILNNVGDFLLSGWKIDRETFDSLSGDPNDLYTKRLTLFNSEDIENFKFASCFKDNARFSLLDLTIATNKPISEVALFLSKAIKYRLLFSSSIFYKFPFHLDIEVLPFEVDPDDIKELASLALFSFSQDSFIEYLHKKVLSKEDLSDYHRLAGLRLYNSVSSAPVFESSQTLIDTANHFSHSYTAITGREEAEIYLKVINSAQKFCFKVYDFNSALKFLKLTRIILEKLKETDKKKLYDIHAETVQCLLLSKDYEGCVEFIKRHSKDFQDDPQIVLFKIQSLSMLSRSEECLSIGYECLTRKGIVVSQDIDWIKANLPILKSRIPQSTTDIRSYVTTVKKVASKSTTVVHQILSELIFILNQSGRMYESSFVHHTLVVHSLENGPSGFSAVGFIGLAISQMKSSPTRAKEYAQFGLSLLKSRTLRLDFINKVLYEYSTALACFLSPIKDLLKLYEIVSSASSQLTSSINIAFFMKVVIRPLLQLSIGTNANTIYSFLIKTVKSSDLENKERRLAFKLSITLLRYLLQLPYDEQYDAYKEYTYEDARAVGYFIGFFYCSVALITSQNNIDKSQLKLMKEKAHQFSTILPHNVLDEFFYLKNLLDRLDDSVHYPLTDSKKELNELMILYDDCKSFSPEFFEPKILVIQAELLRFEEGISDLEILDAFIAAIDAAKRHGFVNDCSFYNERCASWLYKTCKSPKRTIFHLREAVQHARTCGSIVNITKMKEKYSDIFEEVRDETSAERRVSDGSILSPLNYLISSVLTKDSSAREFNEAPEQLINSEVLISASLAISESINVDSIVEKLVTHTILMLDAEYAVVALTDENNAIEYKAVGGAGYFKLLDRSSSTLSIPESLIQEVIESGKSADNFKESSLGYDGSIFKSDPYFFKFVPKSLLCIPIKNELETLGAIYLESSKIAKPFNEKKLELVSLLCTQAAFSLDKARLYQSTMLAKKRAEEATEEKAAFLANMSHEIRTPFNSLFACAGFLLDTKLDPLQLEYVETIQASAKVTLNIIDAILTFSKIEHGSLLLGEEIFSINECIESSMQLVAEQAENKGLELAYFNRSEGSDLVKGDATRFKQIIINLLGNSVKFTQRGSIVINLLSKSVIANEDLYEFTISIKDTGVGIPKNSQSRVFGAFSQIDGSSRRVHGGSGLGLAISKKLVDLMGGTLSFDSLEGEGTTFYLSITSTVTIPEVEKARYGQDSKVLIVDHFGFATESLENELFKETHFQVDVFEDVAEIKTFEQYKIVFLNLKIHDSLPNELIESIGDKLVLLSPYGTSISEEIQSRNFPVLLLPFQRLKLQSIIRSSYNIKRQSLSPRSESRLYADPQGSPEAPVDKTGLSKEFPLKILLVEDNLINTRVALQHLKRFGYTADSAGHGIEALDKCSELVESSDTNYDLILMDLQMPYKDGITTAKELREKYKDELLPIIVAVTANVEREERDQCIACGMADFISKPILPNVLEKVIRKAGEMRFPKKI